MHTKCSICRGVPDMSRLGLGTGSVRSSRYNHTHTHTKCAHMQGCTDGRKKLRLRVGRHAYIGPVNYNNLE